MSGKQTDRTETTNPAEFLADIEIAEIERRHPVPSGMEALGSLISAAIHCAALVGGLLYLSHVLSGWPT